MTLQNRSELVGARRVVVKVGSSSISGDNVKNIDLLVEAISEARNHGSEIVLVTSGAIATAMPLLNLESKPEDLPTSQALAAVGQGRLISRYQASLDRFGIIGAQVLLTSADLEGSETSANASKAIDRLLELGILPIINENDTVATHEIRFGDNDKLAALISELVNADALVLLSDTDALYDRPPTKPGAERIDVVLFGDTLDSIEVGDTSTGYGTGGAVTKVGAAKIAADNGIAVLLTSTPNVAHALNGQDVGTWFEPRAE